MYQAEPFITVEVSQEFWTKLKKTAGERGFCDHVVSHLVYDYEKETWSVEGPRFGEFVGVLERHGFWRPGKDYKEFAETVSEQLSLLPDDPSEAVEGDPNFGDMDVSITHNGRTVHTSAEAMRQASLAGGKS